LGGDPSRFSKARPAPPPGFFWGGGGTPFPPQGRVFPPPFFLGGVFLGGGWARWGKGGAPPGGRGGGGPARWGGGQKGPPPLGWAWGGPGGFQGGAARGFSPPGAGIPAFPQNPGAWGKIWLPKNFFFFRGPGILPGPCFWGPRGFPKKGGPAPRPGWKGKPGGGGRGGPISPGPFFFFWGAQNPPGANGGGGGPWKSLFFPPPTPRRNFFLGQSWGCLGGPSRGAFFWPFVGGPGEKKAAPPPQRAPKQKGAEKVGFWALWKGGGAKGAKKGGAGVPGFAKTPGGGEFPNWGGALGGPKGGKGPVFRKLLGGPFSSQKLYPRGPVKAWGWDVWETLGAGGAPPFPGAPGNGGAEGALCPGLAGGGGISSFPPQGRGPGAFPGGGAKGRGKTPPGKKKNGGRGLFPGFCFGWGFGGGGPLNWGKKKPPGAPISFSKELCQQYSGP